MPNIGRPSRDCDSCRQRRTKCDLVRPACNPCRRKGFVCPGYRDEQDMIFRTETISSYPSSKRSRKPNGTTRDILNRVSADEYEREGNATNSTTLHMTRWRTPFEIPGTRRDQELFRKYIEINCRQLSEYPATEFWTVTVVQWSVHEPVIRQCMVAYMCSHQAFASTPNEMALKSAMSLKDYYRATHALRQYIGGGNGASATDSPSRSSVMKEIVLASIVILYCVARSIGNYKDEKIHKSAGLNILRSWINESRSTDLNVAQVRQTTQSLDRLGPLWEQYSQMNMQSWLFDDESDEPLLRPPSHGPFLGTGPSAPKYFSNAMDAHVALETIQNLFYNQFVSTSIRNGGERQQGFDDHINEIRIIDKRLRMWSASFKYVKTIARNPLSEAMILAKYHTALIWAQKWALTSLIKSYLSFQQFHGEQSETITSNCREVEQAKQIYSLLKSIFVLSAPSESCEITNEVMKVAESTNQWKLMIKQSVVPHLYCQLARGRDLTLFTEAQNSFISYNALQNEPEQVKVEIVLQIMGLLIEIGEQETQVRSPTQKHHHQRTGPVFEDIDSEREMTRLFELFGAHGEL